jgi:hypothetical protein
VLLLEGFLDPRKVILFYTGSISITYLIRLGQSKLADIGDLLAWSGLVEVSRCTLMEPHRLLIGGHRTWVSFI